MVLAQDPSASVQGVLCQLASSRHLAQPAKGVLLSAYLFCNPPLAGHQPGNPTTVLDRLVSTQLSRVTSVVNGGELAFDDVTW